MKRLLFAVAVAGLFAVNALAADPPVTVTPTPVPTGTVITTTTPTVMTTTGTTSTRRFGLFGRFRNRMSGSTYSTPTSGTVVMPSTTVVPGTAAPTIVPSPMPKPIETSSTGSGVVTAGGSTVVPGTMMPMTTTTTQTRMGLIQRLRHCAAQCIDLRQPNERREPQGFRRCRDL